MAAVDGGRAGPRHQVHLVLLEQGAPLICTQCDTSAQEEGDPAGWDSSLWRRQHVLMCRSSTSCCQMPAVTPQQAVPLCYQWATRLV